MTFLQTCDPFNYVDMLTATSRTVKAYCRPRGYRYESYIGVKRGYFAWHSAFNRCYMLAELLERGFSGWAVHLDADAYIADQQFDLDVFLAEHAERAAIMAISADNERLWWDVNSGVVFLNFAHPLARMIVQRWREMVEAIPDEKLRVADVFSRDGFDDQIFLQAILRSAPELEAAIFNPAISLINSPNASFLRQCLRAVDSDLGRRISRIEREVDRLLGGADARASGAETQNRDARRMVDMLYEAVLGRPADPSGLAAFLPPVREMGLIDGGRFLLTRLIESDEYAALSANARA